MNKKDTINRMIAALGTSLVVSALTAHTLNPAIAIASGLVAALGATWWFMKFGDKKQTLKDLGFSLLGSQMGWVALLI